MTPTATAAPAAQRLLNVERIYFEPAAAEHPRGRQVLSRFPDAERVEVSSHRAIPGLFGNEGAVRDWIRTKRTVLVLGVRKTLTFRPNGRSADFIAPGQASGCAMACVYCYVPRHKGFANPITLFVNIDAIAAALRRHAGRQGEKAAPNQTDGRFWTYDLGENSDCSADALLSDNIRDLVALFRELPNAKATWATKYVNRELLGYDPQNKTRIRFSLMPADLARRVDVRTSPVAERIAAINDFVDAGYEVHLNFSPVIVTDGWRESYRELFTQIDDVLSPRAKAQIAAEVIFLTHNADLHEVNVVWHPRGEALLWRPDLQEAKVSEQGGVNLRYRHGLKGRMVADLRELLSASLPYCPVRYAF
jgi:spore photoproduct lyase family protein